MYTSEHVCTGSYVAQGLKRARKSDALMDLCQQLRSATRRQHLLLEQVVQEICDFSSPVGYARYLKGLIKGRMELEIRARNSLSSDVAREWNGFWVGDFLVMDAADLGLVVNIGEEEAWTPFADDSFAWGVTYVLATSALGAKSLIEPAQALGMSDEWGSRHLWVLARAAERWPLFVERLQQLGVSSAYREPYIEGARFGFEQMARGLQKGHLCAAP